MESSQPQNKDELSKTIRKVPIFGKQYQDDVDFEWPLGKDLLAMPRGKPITLSAMSFK